MITSKERMIAALEGRETDPRPVQILTYDGYIARCTGREQWEFDYGTSDDQVRMQLQAIARHPANDAFWVWSGTNRGPIAGMHVESIDGKPYAMFDNGDLKLLNDDPANGLWNHSPEEMHRKYDRMRVRSREDIDEKLGPIVSADDLVEGLNYINLKRISGEVGEEKFLWFNHSSLFATATNYLGGMEDAMILTMTEQDTVEAVLDRVLDQNLEHIEAGARAGGHGVWNCFMYEGTNMISPLVWRRMVKPRIRKLVERSHQLGLKHVAWFLDDCRELVPDLIEIGIDGLATEQPRSGYQCEPGDLRAAAGDANLCIFGWFWESDLLRGDREAIRRTLRKQYDEAGNGKSFVVNTPGLTQEFDPRVSDMIIEEALNLTKAGIG